jgi:hypothetical protein
MSGTDLTITGCLKETSVRLTDAAAVAKAAVVCSEGGGAEAVRISMDLDELLNEANTLHGAVTLLHRLRRREPQQGGGPRV